MYDGSLYALKKVSKKFAMKWKGELIKREFEIMKTVNHPFIAKLVASYSDSRDYNFLIEFCPGGNLYELIRKFKRLPVGMSLYYFTEMLLALEYLHTRYIIFRDIKAENILVDAKGHLKLTDFGLAQKLETRDALVESFCGSPIYIAPETISKEKYSVKVDFYALGVLLYEMIVGSPPFMNRDSNILKAMKLEGKVKYPNSMNPIIKDMIEKCMNRVAPSFNHRIPLCAVRTSNTTTDSCSLWA